PPPRRPPPAPPPPPPPPPQPTTPPPPPPPPPRFSLRRFSLLLFILGGFHPRATADCGARPRPAAAPIDHNW
ncbi:hypothetical protein ACUTFY_09250, partial [Burkholderia pseudomallei]|uniref:hypothetical protein n=1 Tax=Burkholderia pseudomallei TaxID=28450 RepID=UPI004043FE3A